MTMEALCNSEEMLRTATQLWTILDDMAESNPKSYQQFMQQQLKEAKEYYAPPEPFICLKAHILEPSKTPLFINLCRWSKIPAPKSVSEPIQLSAGKMERLSHSSEIYSILDIAFNPCVLERVKDNPAEKDQLIRLSLKYTEEHYKVTLSCSYSEENVKLKGSLQRMRQRLRKDQSPLTLSKNDNKEVTLSQLRSITSEEDSRELILPSGNPAPAKKCLIEEISASRPEDMEKPTYKITTTKDAEGKPLTISLRIELPNICCLSECNLSVSKDDVLIECPEKYRLQLDLPEPVDEEATVATFYKKQGVLVITMPVHKGK